MTALELDDIQGIVLRGYDQLRGAVLALLRIDAAAAARPWLAEVATAVTSARGEPAQQAINLAFTAAGLAALRGPEVTGFPTEFLEGMVTPHRSRLLGDCADSAPEGWAWGGPRNQPVHVVLMLYARDDAAATALHARLRSAFASAGLTEVGALVTHLLPIPGGVKEHFGFRDGISQPAIAADGLDAEVVAGSALAPDRPENTVAAGEFVLGYANEYGQLVERPAVGVDPSGGLPPLAPVGRGFDLGRNGSYLVVRQLAQDVPRFWRFVRGAAGDADAAVRLAAKMVGRWPSGAPLALSSDRDRPELGAENAFGFAAADAAGFACPLGSHARRANPRDSLPDLDAADSIRESKRHRILRRARAYGPPLDASLDPARLMDAPDDGVERGLCFLCLSADLERQFEFVQHTWVGNPAFGSLYSDPDPLLGGRLAGEHDFVAQGQPVRRRFRGLPSFIRVRGGAYCFLPGLRALRALTWSDPA